MSAEVPKGYRGQFIAAVALILFAIVSFVFTKFAENNILLIPGIISIVIGAVLLVIVSIKTEKYNRIHLREQLSFKYKNFAFYSGFFASRNNGPSFPKKIFAYLSNKELIAKLKLGMSSTSYAYIQNGSWKITMAHSLFNLASVKLICERDGVKVWSKNISQKLFTKEMSEEIVFNYMKNEYTLKIDTSGICILSSNGGISIAGINEGLILNANEESAEILMMLISVYTLLYRGGIKMTD